MPGPTSVFARVECKGNCFVDNVIFTLVLREFFVVFGCYLFLSNLSCREDIAPISKDGRLGFTDCLLSFKLDANLSVYTSDPARDGVIDPPKPYVMNAAALGLPPTNLAELTAYKSMPIEILRVLESLKNLREVGLLFKVGFNLSYLRIARILSCLREACMFDSRWLNLILGNK